MPRSHAPLLLALGAIWGASYPFIKVAVDEIAPTTMMSARMVIAAVLPATAILSGAVLLDEQVTVGVVGGLVLILGGVALGSGAVPLTRRAAAPASLRP